MSPFVFVRLRVIDLSSAVRCQGTSADSEALWLPGIMIAGLESDGRPALDSPGSSTPRSRLSSCLGMHIRMNARINTRGSDAVAQVASCIMIAASAAEARTLFRLTASPRTAGHDADGAQHLAATRQALTQRSCRVRPQL